MTRSEFINFLEAYKIPFKKGEDCGWPVNGAVYVYGKPTDIVGFDGRKSSFTPYLRVSHFKGDKDYKPGFLYTRDCGFCSWMTDDQVRIKCFEIGKGVKIDIVKVDEEE